MLEVSGWKYFENFLRFSKFVQILYFSWRFSIHVCVTLKLIVYGCQVGVVCSIIIPFCKHTAEHRRILSASMSLHQPLLPQLAQILQPSLWCFKPNSFLGRWQKFVALHNLTGVSFTCIYASLARSSVRQKY